MMVTRKTSVPLACLAIASAAACSGDATIDAAEGGSAARATQAIDWAAVDAAMGRAGTLQDRGMYRFGMPRTDLTVVSEGVRILPSLALGSWLAMLPSGPGEVVAMGDLVLTAEDLNPVVARLQEGGIGQTAIHKHLPDHTPALWWTHVRARGDPVEIARTVRAALALTGTPLGGSADAPEPEITIDTARISRILGHAGRANSGVYSVGVPRVERVFAMGIEVPPSMGISTAINFQPTGDGAAAVNGDIVMRAPEIDDVVSVLGESGIDVVSIHNHLTDEEPRLFFLHFWAVGDAVEIARGLRAALDRTGAQEFARVWSFDASTPGTPAAGWRIEQTNPRGDGAEWAVARSAAAASGAQVLSLTDPRGARGSTYNLAWTDEVEFASGRIEVKVRAVTGQEDQGGGPVWRVQDRNNYYIARWNPLENNFRVYVVSNGSRREIESAEVTVSAAEWHTITIDHMGNGITGYLDGQLMWQVSDDTFLEPGGVGVWTKADAASQFDDLEVAGSSR